MKQGILKNKDFLLLAQGQIVSNIGNSIHTVAVTWFIFDTIGKDRSGIVLGLFFVCSFIPIIFFGPVSGVFVDRISRKFIIVSTDIIRGVLLLLLCLLTYYNIFPLTFLFLITIVSAIFFTFFNPAVSAVTPNIVHPDDLVKANSITGMSIQISIVIGAAVSGFLYAEIGIVGIYLLNGVSFILSGISEMFIKIPQVKISRKGKSHFLKDFKEGILYVKNDKPTLALLILSLLFNFISQPLFAIVIPKVIKFTMMLDASYLGIFQSVSSVASIGGMIIITTISKRKLNHYAILMFTLILASIIVICYGIPILPTVQCIVSQQNIFIIYCILGFIFMISIAIISIPINVILQKRTPDEFRGRFFALLTTGGLAAAPLGNLIFGTLSDYVLPSVVLFILGFFLLAFNIVMIFSPNLKLLYKIDKL